jgi:hypothetical protein
MSPQGASFDDASPSRLLLALPPVRLPIGINQALCLPVINGSRPSMVQGQAKRNKQRLYSKGNCIF